MHQTTNLNSKNTSVQELLKNRILWRVYLLWFFRRIVPLMVLQILVFILALKLFATNVFIRQVFRNAYWVSASDYWSLLKYSLAAFLNTRPLTQIAILLILGVIALVLRDILKLLMAYKAMWLRRSPK